MTTPPLRLAAALALAASLVLPARSQPAAGHGVPLEIDRPAHAGRFYDVIGRRAALFGRESRSLEAWVYPLEILDGLELSFRLDGYPLEIDGRDVTARIEVRPAATTLVYAHAAFTVRETMLAPVDEAGAIVTLDVDSVLPITIAVSFRPRLRLMWPAASATPNIAWDDAAHAYTITEETGRYAGLIGSPAARDVSLMPYQEEPRGAPTRFELRVGAGAHRVPIAIAGSVDGVKGARATFERLIGSAASLSDAAAAHVDRLDRDTLTIVTPDERLNAAFRWAKVGIDKGIATNPFLGTGLVAGFRTAGDSERPGFAWFFGRDALWTALATDAEGDFEATRIALAFLRQYQRKDGKIPHEISQSASLVDWFHAYPYAWASADATPLYVIAHADYFRASGDRAFIETAWPSIVAAYRFSAATDTDGNGLIENTGVGHGWVEGGALYPPHEEIYLQGLWIAASRGIATLARAMDDPALAARAAAAAERTRAAMESTYWNQQGGFYDFATAVPRTMAAVAEPGPNQARRQARLDQLRGARLIDEDTVLPAVPLWFGVAEDDRAQAELDHLGSAAMATDWGARILSNRSALYDPLSYHYGSVWPLFTGWSAVAAYRYGRPQVGYQALMANARLTFSGALGDVTELLSGDFATEFGRSSHHQVWSEAMVVTPVVRGLLGLDADAGGTVARFEPSLPASWDHVEARGFAAGIARFDFSYTRTPGRIVMRATRTGSGAPGRLVFAPSLPLDARVRQVTVNGKAVAPDIERIGDIQRVRAGITGDKAEAIYTFDEGTDVSVDFGEVPAGATSQALRVLRSHAGPQALRLLVEGIGGRTYALHVRSPRRLGAVDGVSVSSDAGVRTLQIRFDGPAGEYVRRDITIPLLR